MITVPLFDLTCALREAAEWLLDVKSAALGTERKQTLAGLSNPKYHRKEGSRMFARLTVCSAV